MSYSHPTDTAEGRRRLYSASPHVVTKVWSKRTVLGSNVHNREGGSWARLGDRPCVAYVARLTTILATSFLLER